jgi:RNA polymerase sigma factor (sigma-70 family)
MSSTDNREDSFRRLYQAHYRSISAYARRRLDPQDADDIVAETFLVAWRRVQDIPDGEFALPWLYGVARRVISQGRRSGQRRGRLLARLAMVGRHDETRMPETDSLGDRQLVHQALASMRPNDRELLRLAEWEELSAPQLALVFECTPNAIAIRLHRAHRRFRQAFATLESESEPESQREEST